jgi:hypothetical protein
VSNDDDISQRTTRTLVAPTDLSGKRQVPQREEKTEAKARQKMTPSLGEDGLTRSFLF